jgi:hypothetical protein
LRQHRQDGHLVAVKGVVDCRLEFAGRTVAALALDAVLLLLDGRRVLPPFLTVAAVRPWPAHPRLNVHLGSMFQQQLYTIIMSEANDYFTFSSRHMRRHTLLSRLYEGEDYKEIY